MIRHLLPTGHSGVGKTTVMTQLAHALTDYHPDGFFTREIRENGIGKGFELVTFDDGHQLLSHITLPGHSVSDDMVWISQVLKSCWQLSICAILPLGW